jgi:hypothetical protein
VKITHLGNAVVSFENAIKSDRSKVEDFISRTVQRTKPQGYSEIESDKYLSDGGYEYDAANIQMAPTRYQELVYDGICQEDLDVIKDLEQSLYSCLVEYCKLFPSVVETVKWRTRGYLIQYEKSQRIGPHCDTNIPYENDSLVPLNTFPIHNTLTSGVLLNEDFIGGDLYFRSWGITVPKKFGSIVIYPSSFTGCHEVTEVTDGIRYAYLSWFGHGTISNLSIEDTSDGIENAYSWLRRLKNDIGVENMYQKFVPVGQLGVIDR